MENEKKKDDAQAVVDSIGLLAETSWLYFSTLRTCGATVEEAAEMTKHVVEILIKLGNHSL